MFFTKFINWEFKGNFKVCIVQFSGSLIESTTLCSLSWMFNAFYITVYLSRTHTEEEIDMLVYEMTKIDGNILQEFLSKTLQAAGITQLALDGNVFCDGTTFKQVGGIDIYMSSHFVALFPETGINCFVFLK